MRMPCIITLLASAGIASAATVEVSWDITWVNASPDGYERPVIGINGVWPCPILEATVGDTIIAHVNNKLGNETTGLHWHGITQKGSQEMDGPVAGTQCPIPPGSSVTYKFLVRTTTWILCLYKVGWDETDSLGYRPISQAHSGIIHIKRDNILTDYEVLSSSMTLMIRTRAKWTTRLCLPAATGKRDSHLSCMSTYTDLYHVQVPLTVHTHCAGHAVAK